MSQRGFLVLVIAIITVPILAGVNAQAAPSESGKIVFVKKAERFADDQIYVMNEDGSNVTRLWGEPHATGEGFVSIYHLAVSPDGRKIAFVSKGHIYVINADGSDLAQLTADEELHPGDEGPSFSQDGRKIAFSCLLGKPQAEFVVPVLGRVVTPVFQICIMNADGSNMTRLTDPPSENTRPKFSPNAEKIVFNSRYRQGSDQIYVMNVDGSNVTRLTNLPDTPVLGAFSPDGRRIVFTSAHVTRPQSPGAMPSLTPQVYVMNADGSNVTRLINRPLLNVPYLVAWPTFSLDGRKIAFTVSSIGEDDFQIYLMDADGSNVIQLTNPPEISSSPVFIP